MRDSKRAGINMQEYNEEFDTSLLTEEQIAEAHREAANKWSSIQIPVYVGGWNIGGNSGLRFCVTTKPNWFHRFMMKLLLGIEWFDI